VRGAEYENGSYSPLLDLYVYDLLVDKKWRGNNIGRKLLLAAAGDYPDSDVYIFSDADGYYEKQKFPRIGSIFQICCN
jgi:GNAT superfamily N-acetyltransferase